MRISLTKNTTSEGTLLTSKALSPSSYFFLSKGSNTTSCKMLLSDLVDYLASDLFPEFDGTVRHQALESPILRTPQHLTDYSFLVILGGFLSGVALVLLLLSL